MYSVKEASEKLGLDTSQVRRLLRSGEIKGKKYGRDWIVLSLDYKRQRKQKRKNPPLKNTVSDNDKHLRTVYQRIIRDKKGCCVEWRKGFDKFKRWYLGQETSQNHTCHYCGLLGDTSKHYGKDFRYGRRGHSLEVDRKDNSKAYSPDNCVLACYPCNNAKSDVFSYEEFLRIGEAIRRVKDGTH